LPPIIPDQADDSQSPGGTVTPLSMPPRSECWRRIRLAQSLLSHRPASPATSQLVIRVLDGWYPDGAVPAQREATP
jgi:hypothetical protein